MVLWNTSHTLSSLLAFWTKSLFLALTTHLFVYWPVVRWGVGEAWTQSQLEENMEECSREMQCFLLWKWKKRSLAKQCGQPLETGRGKNGSVLPRVSRKACKPADNVCFILVGSHVGHLSTNHKIINLCCCKPQVCGHLLHSTNRKPIYIKTIKIWQKRSQTSLMLIHRH